MLRLEMLSKADIGLLQHVYARLRNEGVIPSFYKFEDFLDVVLERGDYQPSVKKIEVRHE